MGILKWIADNTIGKVGGFFGGILGGLGWGIVKGKAADFANQKIDEMFDKLENLRDEQLKKIPAEELAVIVKYIREANRVMNGEAGEQKFAYAKGRIINKLGFAGDVADSILQNVYDEFKELLEL